MWWHPDQVIPVLKAVCIVAYGLMLPLVLALIFIEAKFPKVYKKLPWWLK